MGRGRAKAKQTKVARELKYRTYETDLEALQRELSSSDSNGNGSEDEDRGRYEAYADEDDNDADEDEDGRDGNAAHRR
jgi:hypothetical protein